MFPDFSAFPAFLAKFLSWGQLPGPGDPAQDFTDFLRFNTFLKDLIGFLKDVIGFLNDLIGFLIEIISSLNDLIGSLRFDMFP